MMVFKLKKGECIAILTQQNETTSTLFLGVRELPKHLLEMVGFCLLSVNVT